MLVAATGVLLALAGSGRAASSGDTGKRYESPYFKRPHHRSETDSPKVRKYVPPPPLKLKVHRREVDDLGPAREPTVAHARGPSATKAPAVPRSQDRATSPKPASHSRSSSRATTHAKGKTGSGSSSHSKSSCGWAIRTGPGGKSCK
jgi:hypothetical protein